MCKYCKLNEGVVVGEKTNDNAAIIRMKGEYHEIKVSLYRYVYEEGDIRINNLVVDVGVNVDEDSYTLREENVKIEYCPFCGEKL